MTPNQTRNLLIGSFIVGDFIFFTVIGVFIYYHFFLGDNRVKNQESQAASLNVGPEYHAWAYASSEYRAAAVCPREADLKFHTDIPKMTLTLSNATRSLLTVNLGQGGFQSDHVYFLSLGDSPKILREVGFEEIGIEPVSAEAMEETGWTSEFNKRIREKITEYLENHGGEIFKTEPQS